MSSGAQQAEPLERRNPAWVRCEDCGHSWIGVYLPMPIVDALKVMKRLCCPMCAADLQDSSSPATWCAPLADCDEPIVVGAA